MTGIADERVGGRFSGEMPIFFPPTDVDEAALPENLTELSAGATIDPTATLVALRADPFTADRAEGGCQKGPP
jgi:hypothetical protein